MQPGGMDAAVDGYVVESPMAGSVWRVHRRSCGSVAAGDEIVTLEAMKSEFAVKSNLAGNIRFLVREGQVVEAGQPLAVIRNGD